MTGQGRTVGCSQAWAGFRYIQEGGVVNMKTIKQGRRMAPRRSATSGKAVHVRQHVSQPDSEDALDDDDVEQDLDIDGLLNPVTFRSSTALRMIEQYREERALQAAIEDSFFDPALIGGDLGDVLPRSGL